jgi:endonuclease YncB( thermonuclease family)
MDTNTIKTNISNNELDKLKIVTDDIPEFSLDGLLKQAKVVSVYDGDSCRIVFWHFEKYIKWNIRMNGYDCPEMKPSLSLPNRDEIKGNAIASRDFLKSLVMNPEQIIYCKCGNFDKYGRLLGTLYLTEEDYQNDKSVNQLMITSGQGYEYHGGKKR